jgi:hypothetical protein
MVIGEIRTPELAKPYPFPVPTFSLVSEGVKNDGW